MGTGLDLVGLKFGRWTVYDLSDKSTPKIKKWDCRCDCGKLKAVYNQSLLNGDSKSCGCARKETAADPMMIDLAGLKFGRLTVYDQVPVSSKRRKGIDWLCRCDCGKLIVTKGSRLLEGKKLSCGCLGRQRSSERLKSLLVNNNFKHGLSHTADYHKNKSLIAKFNITLEQYNDLLSIQNFVCAICKRPETAIHSKSGVVRSLAVDHDHSTGQVRGLLCDSCNKGLGHFSDSPEVLLAASQYLESKKSNFSLPKELILI